MWIHLFKQIVLPQILEYNFASEPDRIVSFVETATLHDIFLPITNISNTGATITL